MLDDRVVVDHDAASGAGFTVLAERFQESEPELLARHLHESERGDLGDLVLGAVAAQAFEHAAQHEVAVGFQNHVDEVHDNDAADVAQPQLAHDFLGGLEVVLSDRFFEVSARTDEFAGVDVDDGHGLGAIDHEGSPGWQPDLAVKCLLDLLRNAEIVEGIVLALVALHAVHQIRCDLAEVGHDDLPGFLAGDDHLLEVFVEDIPHDLDQKVRFAVQEGRGLHGVNLLRDRCPLRGESVDVECELLVGGTLGRGAHDDTDVLGQNLLEDLLQAGPLGVGQLAADAVHRAVRHVDQVAAGQRHLAGQARTLVADRVLGDLHEHLVTRLERELDAAGLTTVTGVLGRGLPVDLTGVEHCVAAASDVDEGGFHARQHVLHLAEVDVADQGGVLVLGDIVLDQHGVFQHSDLDFVVLGTHDHHPVDGFAAGEELGLRDHRAATAGIAAVAATLLLRFEAG